MGAGVLGMFMLVCGFFRITESLPDVLWRYPLHYVSYHTYAFRAFMNEEIEGTTGWECPCTVQPGGCPGGPGCSLSGEDVLSMWDVKDRSYGYDVGILLAMVVGYRVVFFGMCKLAEHRKVSAGRLEGPNFYKLHGGLVAPTEMEEGALSPSKEARHKSGRWGGLGALGL